MNRSLRQTWLFAFTLAVLTVITPRLAASDTGTIRLHDVAGVTGSRITLEEVAELEGVPARALAATVVGRLEDGITRITITDTHVRRALDEAGVNWALVSLQGFQRCRVERIEPRNAGAESVDADPRAVASNPANEVRLDAETSLRALVERQLVAAAGGEAKDVRMTFSERDAELLNVSAMSTRYEVTPQSSTGLGRVPVQIVRYESDRPADRFTVAATVERRVRAVVATETLRPGDRFRPGSVEVRRVYLDQMPESPLDRVELVHGQVAGARLVEGSVLFPDDIRSRVLVKRGELVTVRSIAGNVVVRTVARAREEGSLDQKIRLRHDQSRETFTAVVTGRRSCVIRVEDASTSNASPATSRNASVAGSHESSATLSTAKDRS
ncbi:MAG: flagellar basal body P-ring formation chaperone FlgA [Phycisphaeraceae bacterium]